jgi:DNA (cytosine-5)-methyltransferase 1
VAGLLVPFANEDLPLMKTEDAHMSPTLIPAPLYGTAEPLRVLDLFAGLGGLSFGFSRSGFDVTGVDKEQLSGAVFRLNGLGDHIRADLARESVLIGVPVVVGGPPCRPWSAMNVKRRGEEHAQYQLLERFFDHVMGIRPILFLMENVPSVKNDGRYRDLLQESRSHYSVQARVITYADFGAATKRRRLITVGLRRGTVTASDFLRELESEYSPATTVGEMIGWLRDIPRAGFPDHEWSRLKTIDRYEERYRTGRFGWAQLAYDQPAPSFGSVAKTYILHPEAGVNGFAKRVLSVREVLQIMGFERDFRFPPGTSRTARYQMAADAVSPVFSLACARTVRRLLWGDGVSSRGSGLEEP